MSRSRSRHHGFFDACTDSIAATRSDICFSCFLYASALPIVFSTVAGPPELLIRPRPLFGWLLLRLRLTRSSLSSHRPSHCPRSFRNSLRQRVCLLHLYCRKKMSQYLIAPPFIAAKRYRQNPETSRSSSRRALRRVLLCQKRHSSDKKPYPYVHRTVQKAHHTAPVHCGSRSSGRYAHAFSTTCLQLRTSHSSEPEASRLHSGGAVPPDFSIALTDSSAFKNGIRQSCSAASKA